MSSCIAASLLLSMTSVTTPGPNNGSVENSLRDDSQHTGIIGEPDQPPNTTTQQPTHHPTRRRGGANAGGREGGTTTKGERGVDSRLGREEVANSLPKERQGRSPNRREWSVNRRQRRVRANHHRRGGRRRTTTDGGGERGQPKTQNADRICEKTCLLNFLIF